MSGCCIKMECVCFQSGRGGGDGSCRLQSRPRKSGARGENTRRCTPAHTRMRPNMFFFYNLFSPKGQLQCIFLSLHWHFKCFLFCPSACVSDLSDLSTLSLWTFTAVRSPPFFCSGHLPLLPLPWNAEGERPVHWQKSANLNGTGN